MINFGIKDLFLNILTFLCRTLRDPALLISELGTTNQELIKHVLTDQKQPVTMHMNAIDLVYGQIGIQLKKYFQVSSHGHYFGPTTEKYQLVAY